MNTEEILKLRDKFDRISKAINMCADMTLLIDAEEDGAGHFYRYSDADIMNSLHILSHVYFNVMYHKGKDSGKTKEDLSNLVIKFSKELVKLTKKFCEVDSTTFYKKK